MFINKLFTYFTCAYLKKYNVFYCEIFDMLFLYEGEDIVRFFCIIVPLIWMLHSLLLLILMLILKLRSRWKLGGTMEYSNIIIVC